jgi:TPR repeat protein
MSHEPSSALPAPPASLDDLRALGRAGWQTVLRGEPRSAFAWISAAARLGDADAQAVAGQWLLVGHGTARDPVPALHWFLHAAQQRHPMGMNMAGRCHEQGWGTPVDTGKAAHWYREALRADLPEARYNLANLLASGDGVPRDQARAFVLYREAAAQGYAKAYAKLGRYHEDGLVTAALSVPQDAAIALDCYRRGAEGGDFRGQFCYAGMLAALGRESEALQWLAKVPATATPRFLREAGELLLGSPRPAFAAIGRQMLETAGGVPLTRPST